MKIEDLRPCDNCQGPVAPVFYQVALTQTMINAQAVNAHLGLQMQLGGSHQLAKVMGTDEDVDHKLGTTTLYICQDCTLSKEINLGSLIQQEIDKAKESKDGGN